MGRDHRQLAGVDRPHRPELPQHGPPRAGHARHPAGTAYAIWTGLGAVGVIIGGMILFGDKVSLVQAGFMAMIVIGVAGTKLFGQG